MKLAIVLGTRPEIVKLSPIIRACEKHGINYFLVHTGQHYSPNMDAVFFEDLKLPAPQYNLNIGHLPFRKRVGECVARLEAIFSEEWPDVVLVQGDTFSVLMGALAAKKLDRPVAHLEAGLRSHDLSMPEENYRIIVDHLSEFLYPPTKQAEETIIEEGMGEKQSAVFGNTGIDALTQNLSLSEEKSTLLKELNLVSKKYFLVTAHRQENVDVPERLKGIFEGLKVLSETHSEEIVFALHPRTKARLKEFDIHVPSSIRFIDPPGYLDFISLLKNARIVITDSGGIQEESSVLKVPCVTLRDNTERPETVLAGCNVLAGCDPKVIVSSTQLMLTKKIRWKLLYGDGSAAEQIVLDLSKRIRIRKSLSSRLRWVFRSVQRVIRGNK